MFETDRVEKDDQEKRPWEPAVGSTVRLKSGGPVMTVVTLKPGSGPDNEGAPVAMCKWFNAHETLWGTVAAEWFPYEALQLYTLEVK